MAGSEDLAIAPMAMQLPRLSILRLSSYSQPAF
jgi:hypothetical protein